MLIKLSGLQIYQIDQIPQSSFLYFVENPVFNNRFIKLYFLPKSKFMATLQCSKIAFFLCEDTARSNKDERK